MEVPEVDNQEFTQLWQELTSVILRLIRSPAERRQKRLELDALKVAPMDPALFQYTETIVIEHEEETNRIQEQLDQLLKQQEQIAARYSHANHALWIINTIQKTPRILLLLFGVATRSLLYGVKTCHLSAWMALLLLLSVVVFVGEERANRCPTEGSRHSPLVRKVHNFQDIMEDYRTDFVGRQWLFEELRTLVLDNKTVHSGVMIVGPRGVGKSAIFSQLVCSVTSIPEVSHHIIGYHLCSFTDRLTLDPAKFVQNVVHMLISRLSAYEKYILYDSTSNKEVIEDYLSKGQCDKDPSGCFEQTVLTPLRSFKPDPPQSYLLIDALDECEEQTGLTIVDLLKLKLIRFPPWLRLIVTTRNVPAIVQRMTDLLQTLALKAEDDRNIGDIDKFVRMKLAEHTLYNNEPHNIYHPHQRVRDIDVMGMYNEEVNKLVRDGKHIHDAYGLMVNQSSIVVAGSETMDNFLTAKWVTNYLVNVEVGTESNVSEATKHLGFLHEPNFLRVFPDIEEFKITRILFEILCASYQSVSYTTLYDVYSLATNHTLVMNKQYDYPKLWNKLSHFLRISEDNTIFFHHASILNWLTDPERNTQVYYIDNVVGNRYWLEYFVNIFSIEGKIFEHEELIVTIGLTARHGIKLLKNGMINLAHMDSVIKDIMPSCCNTQNCEVALMLYYTAIWVDDEDLLSLYVRFCGVNTAYDKETAAHWAVYFGRLHLLMMLVDMGADINHSSHLPGTPLHWAVTDKDENTTPGRL